MFNLVQPYSGHYYECEWQEWDNVNETYKSPISFRIKGNAQIGVSTGLKETIQVFEQGRPVMKEIMKVNTVATFNFKPKDKVKLINTDTIYIIVKVSDDLNHPNAIQALQFRNTSVPKVLYLGDV